MTRKILKPSLPPLSDKKAKTLPLAEVALWGGQPYHVQ